MSRLGFFRSGFIYEALNSAGQIPVASEFDNICKSCEEKQDENCLKILSGTGSMYEVDLIELIKDEISTRVGDEKL